MEEYAHRKNIELFEREISSEEDPERRKLLEDLLAEEREQLTRVIGEKKRDRQ